MFSRIAIGSLAALLSFASGQTFEVASVKANHSGEEQVSGGFQPGGRYRVTNYTLRALIAAAYLRPQVNPGFLIVGGQKGIDSDRFDIDARAAGASHKDIAAAVFGDQVVRRSWSADGELRAQVRYLVRRSAKLASNGYRHLAGLDDEAPGDFATVPDSP